MLQIDGRGARAAADLLLLEAKAQIQCQVRQKLPLILAINRSARIRRRGGQRIQDGCRERRRIIGVETWREIVDVSLVNVVDLPGGRARVVDESHGAALEDEGSAAFRVAVGRVDLLAVGANFELMLAEERADVGLGDVAPVLLILEETEAAGNDGRNLRTVAGPGDGRACAADRLQLIVTASLGIDIPSRP